MPSAREPALAGAMDDHRVELHLLDQVAMRRGEARELRHQRRERVDIGRQRAAKALEQPGDAQLAQHAARAFGIDRRQAIDHVLEQLGHHAAGADHHQRAEAAVADRADDHLDARPRHGLQQYALQPHVRPMAAQFAKHGVVALVQR